VFERLYAAAVDALFVLMLIIVVFLYFVNGCADSVPPSGRLVRVFGLHPWSITAGNGPHRDGVIRYP
jgi:hypothetical protein